MNRLNSLLILVFLMSPLWAANPGVLFERAVRDRAEAFADSVHRESPEKILDALDALAVDPALSEAQRDAVAWDLLRRIRLLEPTRQSMAVVERLENWQSQAFRTHQESPNWPIPLFNVAAAATGLGHQWAFGAGVKDASGDGAEVSTWLGRYALDPQTPYARGVRSVLFRLSDWQLEKMISAIDGYPALHDTLLPEVWMARGQLDLLSDWMRTASESRVSALMLRARRELSVDQEMILGQALLNHSAPSVQALAVARLTDMRLSDASFPQQWAAELWTMRANSKLASAVDLQLIRLKAPGFWAKNPALAPPEIVGSDAFKQLQSLADAVENSTGGVR